MTAKTRLAWVIGAAVTYSSLAIACADQTDRGENLTLKGADSAEKPVSAPPSLRMIPEDLSNSPPGRAAMTLYASVALSRQELAQLKDAFQLVRWPSRELVVTEAVESAVEELRPAGGVKHQLTLTVAKSAERWNGVRGPLAEEWHAVSLDLAKLPPALAASFEGKDTAWPGHYVQRFAPSSAVAVMDVRTETAEEVSRVTVRFSQRMRDPRPADTLLRVTEAGKSLACILSKPAQDPSEASEEFLSPVDLAGEAGTHEIALLCPTKNVEGLELEVEPTLASVSGAPLGDAYGDVVRIVLGGDATDRRRHLAAALGLE
jgi:hypothetical protein